jgi:hypothetical protein
MNNMPAFDSTFCGSDMWERKRSFLRQYKFTVAIENYSQRGYNTEKITDPLLAGSVPIYWGNPEISRHINPDCFINAHDYLPYRFGFAMNSIDRLARDPYRPGNTISDRAGRRFRRDLRKMKMELAFGRCFDRLIDRIREIDNDREQYLAMLYSPRLTTESERSAAALRDRWIEIFSGVGARNFR